METGRGQRKHGVWRDGEGTLTGRSGAGAARCYMCRPPSATMTWPLM